MLNGLDIFEALPRGKGERHADSRPREAGPNFADLLRSVLPDGKTQPINDTGPGFGAPTLPVQQTAPGAYLDFTAVSNGREAVSPLALLPEAAATPETPNLSQPGEPASKQAPPSDVIEVGFTEAQDTAGPPQRPADAPEVMVAPRAEAGAAKGWQAAVTASPSPQPQTQDAAPEVRAGTETSSAESLQPSVGPAPAVSDDKVTRSTDTPEKLVKEPTLAAADSPRTLSEQDDRPATVALATGAADARPHKTDIKTLKQDDGAPQPVSARPGTATEARAPGPATTENTSLPEAMDLPAPATPAPDSVSSERQAPDMAPATNMAQPALANPSSATPKASADVEAASESALPAQAAPSTEDRIQESPAAAAAAPLATPVNAGTPGTAPKHDQAAIGPVQAQASAPEMKAAAQSNTEGTPSTGPAALPSRPVERSDAAPVDAAAIRTDQRPARADETLVHTATKQAETKPAMQTPVWAGSGLVATPAQPSDIDAAPQTRGTRIEASVERAEGQTSLADGPLNTRQTAEQPIFAGTQTSSAVGGLEMTAPGDPSQPVSILGGAQPAGGVSAPGPVMAAVQQPANIPLQAHAAAMVAAPQDVVDIVSTKMAGDDRPDRITVQLDPPELGRVSIEFKFDAQGLQQVAVRGETPEAMRQLRLLHFDLVQSLEQQGLNPRDMTFSQGFGSNSFAGQDRPEGPNGFGPLSSSDDDTISRKAPPAFLQASRLPASFGPSGLNIKL